MAPKSKKKHSQLRKSPPTPAINPPARIPFEEPPKYWFAFKALLRNRRFLLLLVLLCVPAGIAAQLSFIQFRCVAEPFLGSTKAACKDNMLRMILGGPLVFLVGLFVSAWVKQQKQKVSENMLLLPFVALLPTVALPFIHNEPLHDKVILIIKVVFALTFAFVARHKLADLLRKLFAKPEFRMDCSLKKNDLTIRLDGKMLPDERGWIFARTLAVIGSYGAEFDRITIDCENLQQVPEEFAPVVEMLLSFARFAGKSVEIQGENALRPGSVR